MPARGPGDVTHANVAQPKPTPPPRRSPHGGQCPQLRRERTRAADPATAPDDQGTGSATGAGPHGPAASPTRPRSPGHAYRPRGPPRRWSASATAPGAGAGATTPPSACGRIQVRSIIRQEYPELTLWGPGVRPDPFPAQPGSAMLRVTFELGKEAGNVCLRRDRRAPQALPGGGHRSRWRGGRQPQRAERGGADPEGDRRAAAGGRRWRSRPRSAPGGWWSCWRAMASTRTWCTRCGARRSPPRG